MTLEDRLNEVNDQLRNLALDERSLVEQQIRVRWLVREAQKATERAKEITSALHPPEDHSGEKSA